MACLTACNLFGAWPLPWTNADFLNRNRENRRQWNFSQHFSLRNHDGVIRGKHFPRYWPLVRGIPRPPVDSPRKGQWRGALMFSFIRAWPNGWLETPPRSWWRHCSVYSKISCVKLCRPFCSGFDVFKESKQNIDGLAFIVKMCEILCGVQYLFTQSANIQLCDVTFQWLWNLVYVGVKMKNFVWFE